MNNQRTRATPPLSVLVLVLLLGSCSVAEEPPASVYPTYDPFLRGAALTQVPVGAAGEESGVPRGPVPTYAPLTVRIPARPDGAPLVTPTPDAPRVLPTPRQLADEYVVQPGDTIGAIAQAFGVGIDTLLEANELSQDEILSLGTTLRIPSPEPADPGPTFKVIPDSEMVYGPAAAEFDIDGFVSAQGGYLSQYSEEINTAVLSGSAIIELVAQNYSVNPRLLLAVLEYRSRWVTEAEPLLADPDYPLGFVHPSRVGLYRQLAWAANELNRGYYLWRANAVGTWVLNDGTVVPIDPTINSGTAAVQHFFSEMDDRATWDEDVNAYGLFQTYFFMFGNPFDLALEPLVAAGLLQPAVQMPFEAGVSWAFTGGPHAAWDSGSAWGALDFAPPDVMGCAVSHQWIASAADGFVVRASDGAVVQDLDGDGFEQTGWNILYMHVFEQDRVLPGAYLYAGDRIGHPSCEGGLSNASHLHLARKYNGEWIPADGSLPFMLGGWISSGDGNEYDGTLRRGSEILVANEGASDTNLISR